MAQIEIKNLSISLKGNEILKNIDFKMNDKEKIGIVGRNGSGKTTFLRFLMGEVDRDYNDDGSLGEIIKDRKANMGFLSQVQNNSDISAHDFLREAYKEVIDMKNKIDEMTEALSKEYNEALANKQHTLLETYINMGGHYYEKELKRAFSKFGFNKDEIEKKMSEFSGGQVTKISMLKLLLSKPDVLLLDEPTNHLDIDAIEWMEEYLSKYDKNVILVSHDRMFLDNVCNVIIDVENQKLVRYEGNYTEFLEQKKIRHELQVALYEKNQKEIERLTELTERFRYKATKASMVKSKDKIIERIKENMVRPEKEDKKNFHYHIIPIKEGGKEVLNVEMLQFGYEKGAAANKEIAAKNEAAANAPISPNNKVIGTVNNLIVYKGDRLAIIGKNGTGKSTLLKTLVGKIPKISGKYKFGFDIEYEYFDQNVAENDSEKTLFEYFSECYPSLNNEEVRNRLGRFLFTGQDVEKIVKNLSGGEKVRLAFAKLFEKRPNLLILDEPTNHLDILGKESLENIIEDYKGTVIFVSHDRYFTKKVANKILYFEENKNTFFEYGYDDYEKYIKIKKGEEESRESEYVRKTRKENEKLLRMYNDAFDANNYKKYIKELAFADKLYDEDGEGDIAYDKDGNPIDYPRPLTGEEEYQLQKQKQKNERLAKRKEEKIAALEEEVKKLSEEYTKEEYQADFDKLCELNLQIEEKQKMIETLMEEWEKLSENQ